MTSFTTQQICERVDGELHGAGDLPITGVEQLDRAVAGQITFIGSRAYAERWPSSQASAALVGEDLDVPPGAGRTVIRVANTDLALATVLAMFAPPQPRTTRGIHDRAVVDPEAALADGVAVGALSYVGPRVRVGSGTIIHPNVTVMDDCTIGAGCVLWPGVVVRERCEIGDHCILHANVTIGADGFGYRPAPDGRSLVKIPQIGTVRLGRDVEIGAGTCIDRGKFSATSIGDGTKIDNLCQVGHNTHIGLCVIIAGLVGIGGSVTIGDGAMLGGGSIIKDHVTIGAGSKLGGQSGLLRDLPAGEEWHGHPAHSARAVFREFSALRRLPEFMRTLKKQKRPGKEPK